MSQEEHDMSVTQADAARVSAALKHAMEAADREELNAVLSPEAIIWHNTDLVELRRTDLVDAVVGIGAVCRIAMDVRVVGATDRGFLQAQEWTFSAASGETVRIHSAFAITLDADGRVVRLDEYVDSSGLAALTELVTAASAAAGS